MKKINIYLVVLVLATEAKTNKYIKKPVNFHRAAGSHERAISQQICVIGSKKRFKKKSSFTIVQ